MHRHHMSSYSLVLRLRPSFFLLTIATVLIASSTSVDAQSSRDDQIKAIQKQIDSLNQQVKALRDAEQNEAKQAKSEGSIPAAWMKGLRWRSIGPAAMGGRITDLAVYEKDPCIYYVATASGGLLKTTNAGNTFVHQFDQETSVSIGDVCVAQSNPDIVWVGTGENNPRNSVSYGDGVYKSVDGGKTWKNMGLKESFQVGRIIIHPTNPDIVYVGALGRLYGPNKERGLFKTSDGGQTWNKILYIDENTGVIDVQMHPTNPETLLVATYERRRDGFDSYRGEPAMAEGYDAYDPIKKWGPGSGLHKTTDGGTTFKKLTKGLPTCELGRIGFDYYRKNPDVIYAIVESAKIAQGTAPGPSVYIGIFGEDAPGGARLTRITDGGPANKGGLLADDVVLAVDAKPVKNYSGFIAMLREHKPNDKIKVQVSRGDKKPVIEVTLAPRPERQRAPSRKTRPYWYAYGGQQANVQDKQGPNSFEYGGIYKSSDGGESWTRVNSLNPRPMYFSVIRVDPSDDQHIYVCGISLHRSKDGGKTFTADGNRRVHPDQHALWINERDGRHIIVGCDGGFYVTHDRMQNWDHLNHMSIGQFYHVTVDTKKPYNVYGGLQDNGTWGGPSIGLRGAGPINEDWIAVSGGDGFVCRVDRENPNIVYYESQDGNLRRRNLVTGASARIRPQPPEGQRHRFNWNTPFILSNHNSKIYYCVGEYVFRSFNMGTDLRIISPEITRTKRGTGTAISESPRNAQVLYVGSDDGALWVTRNGGQDWTDISKNIELPGPRWVATIEASRFADGRAYVAFDAHRSDDDNPYLFVTEDFGETWKPLHGSLPRGSTRCLREDVVNENLLFVGTEFAAWASIDRGQSWNKLNTNLPTVAIHEIAVHPTEGEIVAATHGRSLWVLDIMSLRQLTTEVVKADAHLYKPADAMRWRSEPRKGSIYGSGMRLFVGDNPPRGAQIYYSLAKKATSLNLKIVDATGATIRQLRGRSEPGLHRVSWDLSQVISRSPTLSRLPRPTTENSTPGVTPTQNARPASPTATRSQTGSAGAANAQRRPQTTQSTRPPTNRRRSVLRAAAPGLYRIVLTVDGTEYAQTIRLDFDSTIPSSILAIETEIPETDDGDVEKMEGDEEDEDGDRS